MHEIEPGVYRHYKNPKHTYEVIGIACNESDTEPMVVYRANYDIPELEKQFGVRPLFTRPLKSFCEEVKVDGKKMKRFERID